ncbi:signal peptidase II [Halalkalibaculum sp. DA384]|uniref:signal peptidase II n=1 Tax=Halalkalibaculum sp. DA384 TaxID=3373606 RepID=UPI003755352F
MKRNKLIVLWIPALVIVTLDQVTKHLVRTTPSVQNWDIIPGWLSFHYTQNPGMALGMDWISTPAISSIAIVATIGIIVYILRSLEHANLGYLACMGLVLGGAFGNIIDRLVMGYIESYGGILEGHVIDFIHFTLRIDGYPVFPYIFNVADIAISIAIISLLLFHQRILPVPPEERYDDDDQESERETPGSKQAAAPAGGGISIEPGPGDVDIETEERSSDSEGERFAPGTDPADQRNSTD